MRGLLRGKNNLMRGSLLLPLQFDNWGGIEIMGGLQIVLCAQELVCNVESDTIELRPMPKCKNVMPKRVSSELREVTIVNIGRNDKFCDVA